MFRRGLIVPFVLAAVPVAAAAWVLSPAFIPESPTPAPAQQNSVAKSAGLPELDALTPRTGSPDAAGFDVARIDPGGWSVFAGTAPPSSTVTVTADGKPIGTVTADARGEWTLLSDHRFAAPDPVLGLSTSFGQPAPAPAAEKPVADLSETRTNAAAADSDPSTRMMRDLEDLVAAARKPQPPDTSQSAVRAPVPIPIQFVFRRARLTADGRRAADLLAEYLSLKRPESIVLTGHADERGSEAFNLLLSRRRLETVAALLRQSGFAGRLVLVPKGSSEPYDGVDRTTLNRRQLWQLDRRVELVLDAEAPPDRLGQR